MKNKFITLKRGLAAVLAISLALSPLPAAMPERAAEKAEAEDVTLQNPRIVPDDSMEAGQKVTWDCVWFGSYPQAEVIPGGVEYTAFSNDDFGSSDFEAFNNFPSKYPATAY